MKETMEWILSTWSLYWGEGYYQYLLLTAAVYLLFCRRKKEGAKYLLSYLVVVLIVFFCPLTASIIRKCIGGDVYWRVLWIVPVVPLIAYAGTEFLKERKKPLIRGILVLVLAASVVFCGKSLWQAGNYERVHNYQQVPDEVAQVCDLINSKREGGRAHLATDDYLASYVRIYDASVTMPYGRAGRGARSAKSRQLYNEISSPAPDYERIAELARSRRCNFIAVKLPDEATRAAVEKSGFMLAGMVNEYGVFMLEK